MLLSFERIVLNMSTTSRLNVESDENKQTIRFSFNGEEMIGHEGEPIAAALMANGITAIRVCEVTGEPRGVYCGIGHCYECRAEVDGIPNVRTCLSPLKRNMSVLSKPFTKMGVE